MSLEQSLQLEARGPVVLKLLLNVSDTGTRASWKSRVESRFGFSCGLYCFYRVIIICMCKSKDFS